MHNDCKLQSINPFNLTKNARSKQKNTARYLPNNSVSVFTPANLIGMYRTLLVPQFVCIYFFIFLARLFCLKPGFHIVVSVVSVVRQTRQRRLLFIWRDFFFSGATLFNRRDFFSLVRLFFIRGDFFFPSYWEQLLSFITVDSQFKLAASKNIRNNLIEEYFHLCNFFQIETSQRHTATGVVNFV